MGVRTITLQYEEKIFRKLEKEKEKSGLSWEKYFLHRIFFQKEDKE